MIELNRTNRLKVFANYIGLKSYLRHGLSDDKLEKIIRHGIEGDAGAEELLDQYLDSDVNIPEELVIWEMKLLVRGEVKNI